MARFTVNYHFIEVERIWEDYDADRANFQRIYAGFLREEPGIVHRVLDVGCGHTINPTLSLLSGIIGQLDGVDPFPSIVPPAHLKNYWVCKLENLPVSDATYDMAYSYNVVEHVDNDEQFLLKAISLLKPGGVYWSMSPNAHHPFTWVTRFAQSAGLLRFYRRYINQRVNDYRAFYKLSNDKRVVRVLNSVADQIQQVDFYYVNNVNWDTYFPISMRWIAKLLDRAILLKFSKRGFIFMFRISKISTV
jgi:SAM-dependent methyltransferase